MTILYMQGFDLHRSPSGWDWGDLSQSWTQSAGATHTLVPGYAPGTEASRALVVDKAIGGFFDLVSSTGRYVIGFWSQGYNPVAGAEMPFFSFRAVITGEKGDSFIVAVDGDGSFRLSQTQDEFDINAWGLRTNISGVSAVGSLSTAWAYYEITGDFSDGSMTLKKDGVTLLTGVGGLASSSLPTQVTPLFRILGESTRWDFLVDHVWIADILPTAGDVLAVQTDIAQDRFEGLGGFKATLLFGSVRKETVYQRSQISSITYGPGSNVTNVTEHLWATDPRDGSAWNQSKFDEITDFGMCHENPFGYGADEARVDGIVLSKLMYNSGKPLVLPVDTMGISYVTGTWRRSSAALTYGGHIATVPRDDIALEANAFSVYTKEQGCLLFGVPAVPTSVTPTIDTFGITFAEEFRTDYRDWTRVLGNGNPFESYFTTGYGVFGEGNKQFQNNYVTVNYKNVITGGAYIQGLWDYTNDPGTGRWSMKQLVYKNSSNQDHDSRKLKIRGHGKALQLKILNYGERPFEINGWALLITSNAAV